MSDRIAKNDPLACLRLPFCNYVRLHHDLRVRIVSLATAMVAAEATAPDFRRVRDDIVAWTKADRFDLVAEVVMDETRIWTERARGCCCE